jgi:hypothetical protein
VDADTYLRTLRKEKTVISTALDTLNKQIKTAEEMKEKAKEKAKDVLDSIAEKKLELPGKDT